MSRSSKKTPVCGLSTAGSEKDDKRRANRMLRRKARAGDPENAPHLREVADVWAMAKDGKMHFDPAASKNRRLLRK